MRTVRSSSRRGGVSAPSLGTRPPRLGTPPDQAPPGPGTPLDQAPPLWTEFLTHASEIITLPGGKKDCLRKFE